MVTDSHDAEREIGQRKKFQRLDDLLENFSKSDSFKMQKNSVTKNPDFLPEKFEISEPLSSILIDKSHFKITETENINTLPSTHLHNTKVSISNASLDNNQITSSSMIQLFDPTSQTFVKSTFHP